MEYNSNNTGAFLWNIEKVISKGDYNYVVVKEHPNAIKHGYVLHHRIVMENYLGRILDTNEVVHHINGDKKDNRIENLELMDNSSHARLHRLEKGSSMVKLRCPMCKKIFSRKANQTHLIKSRNSYTCCSRTCSGKFSRSIQLHGITQKVELAISENIIMEYNSNDDNSEETV